MTERKSTILVGGYLGLLQAGGAVWDYIQYPLGLLKMGYDVYYLEDTMMYPVFSKEWDNSKQVIERLQGIMKSFGMEKRWIYRDEVTHSLFGQSEIEYRDICGRADILLNVSCSVVRRPEYDPIPVRILLDTDPMFTQLQMVTSQSFTSETSHLMDLARWHTHHFSFGENIGRDHCLIPPTPFDWKTTRQPVCLEYWDHRVPVPADAPFTTLMNWRAGKQLVYNGMTWGQKDITFPVIQNIPLQIPQEHFLVTFSMTNGGTTEVSNALQMTGWKVVTPEIASGNQDIYRSFIYASKAEISVAKETYVKANTGWFSCRSACYLASGRPVITQDTGWSSHYPVGRGLLAFRDEKEALESVREVSAHLKTHSTAARELAEAFFDHRVVLQNMLDNL